MKRILMFLTMAAMVWILSTTAAADENAFLYSLEEDETITITGYSGEEVGDLVIPETIDGYPVRTIGDYAFLECSGFDGTLTIPDSIEYIGNGAFWQCSGLTGSLVLPDSITYIGEYAFADCSGFDGTLTLPKGLTSIEKSTFFWCIGLKGILSLPDGITKIDDAAFCGCKSFTGYLNIPKGVAYIGRDAFSSCSGFSGFLRIPDSVTHINDYAFQRCTGFTGTLTLSGNIETIGAYAFRGCTGFDGRVTLEEGISDIGGFAFAECSNITHIVLPVTLASVGEFAFYECNKLATAYIYGAVPDSWGENVFSRVSSDFTIYCTKDDTSGWTFPTWTAPGGMIHTTVPFSDSNFTYTVNDDKTITITGYTGKETGGIMIPETIDGYTVTAIGEKAFYDRRSITGTLTIPDSVTTIGDYAFYCCMGLTGKLDLPEALESIGKLAFRACYGFTGTLTLPERLTTIGEAAFYECEGLTVTIPKNVSSIGGMIFSGCCGWHDYRNHISEIAVDAANAYYTSQDGILFSKDMTVLHSAPPGIRFTEYTIPDSVTQIMSGGFENCYSLSSITIPEGVVSLGEYAFSCCYGLKTVTLPASIDTVERFIFANCYDLSSVRFTGAVPADWNTGALNGVGSEFSEALTVCVPSTHLDSTAGWTYPTWKAPDGVVYNTVVYNPDDAAYTPVGDLSGDGILDSDDVTAFSRWFAGRTVSLPEGLADLDGNGKITRRDAMILARTVAGWDGYHLPWKEQK